MVQLGIDDCQIKWTHAFYFLALFLWCHGVDSYFAYRARLAGVLLNGVLGSAKDSLFQKGGKHEYSAAGVAYENRANIDVCEITKDSP